jgi:hypothetical protein
MVIIPGSTNRTDGRNTASAQTTTTPDTRSAEAEGQDGTDGEGVETTGEQRVCRFRCRRRDHHGDAEQQCAGRDGARNGK